MGRIYFQRGSAQGYKANIARTLSSPLSREKIANVLGILGRTPSLAPVVASIQTDRPVFVWGTKSRQHVEIETMKTGDLAVFIVEGNPLHFGTISIILADDAPLEIRQALSDELWGENVWEYVWFLTDVKAVGLKKPDLERLLGRTLADLFGPYGTFRGVDERDTAAGSLAAFVAGLAKGIVSAQEPPRVRPEAALDPDLERLKTLLEARKQIILYGPPGTGKTYRAIQLAEAMAGGAHHEIVQFHPSYTYEEFVIGIRPVTQNGQVQFVTVSGTFKKLCDRAKLEPSSRFVMIIDEINRGNIPKIFGELLFAIEYRNKGVRLQYTSDDTHLTVPDNVYIIGTMNTADRSIALIDVALRRRFYFEEMRPDYDFLEEWVRKNSGDEMAEVVPKLLQTINARISRLVDRDHVIGHTYFMKRGIDWSILQTAMYHEIIPLLQEYFYNEPQKLRTVLGTGFVLELKEESELGGSFYELVPNRGISEFKDAVASLLAFSESPLVTR